MMQGSEVIRGNDAGIIMYHVSPVRNRESILRNGLKAEQFYDKRPSTRTWHAGEGRYIEVGEVWPGPLPDWMREDSPGWPQRLSVFAIPGQPQATYLASSQDDALAYADHYRARFNSKETLALDLWQVQLPELLSLEPDQDWPGQAFYTFQGINPKYLRWLRSI